MTASSSLGSAPAPRPRAGRLGILAGGGPLPRRLVEACRGGGRDSFVLAFTGQTDPATVEGEVDHAWVRLGAVGEILSTLKRAGVQELVLIGPVSHPAAADLRPDFRGMMLLAKVGIKALSDDGILRAAVSELESEGFRILAIEEVMSELRTAPGPCGRLTPDDAAIADIALGIKVLAVLAPFNIGQAVVVQQQRVIGVEAVEGTDGLLERAAQLRERGSGGVLVKLAKTGQERRVDLPTIGVRTVELAAAAGLAGIAVEAGGSLIVDRDAVAAAADAAGLFVVGIEVPA